jgi:hypothetical protein
MPYLNFTWGPVFARIDTFGVQLAPLGDGALELVGQYRGDGYRVPGLRRRDDAIPLGLGTLQVTPVGAFGLNVLGDLGPSGGLIVQARYLAQFRLGRTTLFPNSVWSSRTPPTSGTTRASRVGSGDGRPGLPARGRPEPAPGAAGGDAAHGPD